MSKVGMKMTTMTIEPPTADHTYAGLGWAAGDKLDEQFRLITLIGSDARVDVWQAETKQAIVTLVFVKAAPAQLGPGLYQAQRDFLRRAYYSPVLEAQAWRGREPLLGYAVLAEEDEELIASLTASEPLEADEEAEDTEEPAQPIQTRLRAGIGQFVRFFATNKRVLGLCLLVIASNNLWNALLGYAPAWQRPGAEWWLGAIAFPARLLFAVAEFGLVLMFYEVSHVRLAVQAGVAQQQRGLFRLAVGGLVVTGLIGMLVWLL